MKRTRTPVQPREPSEPKLVQIEKPIYGGAFLARVNGKATFVPLTLPGERARVRITEEKRGYATAEPEEIVAAAPNRVTPVCRHFGNCGGCNYQHADYETQLALKQKILSETMERGGVRVPETIDVLAGEPWRYRNRIRLAFDSDGRPGYRARWSHSVIPISECPIGASILIEGALAAAEFSRMSPTASRPSESTFFCNAEETELLASLVISGWSKAQCDDLARSLSERIPALRGVEFLTESGRENEARIVSRWGASSLTYRAADFGFRVDQGAFFQVNRWLIDSLVARVTDGQVGKIAWDLFAGVGLFARRLTSHFESVVAVESAPAAIPALGHNLAGTRSKALKAETLEFLRNQSHAKRPDLIVVDPPRTGLGMEVAQLLSAIGAPTLIYVSCDPATLARDLRTILASGNEIESMALADLFPQTFHLETIVHLRRA